jgi:hypothetical protein
MESAMPLATRGVMLVLSLIALTAITPVRAQGNLTTLKTEWKARKYDQVLQPLLDYRDTLGDQGNAEVDYMIGTSMCHWPQLKIDGRAYLEMVRKAYGDSPKIDGRIVLIRNSINNYCGAGASDGCAGTTGKADSDSDCAGLEGKVDSLSGSGTRGRAATSPQGIRDEVKKRILSPLHLESDVDRPGKDSTSFDLPKPDPTSCQQACANDNSCKAFTYVKPTYQGPNARCWLKASVPQAHNDRCCISGVK